MKKTLEDTVVLMVSDNYKERFVAEYAQTKIRYEKLKHFCDQIEASELATYKGISHVEEPLHDCPLELLRDQQNAMGVYLHALEIRAILEHVDLSNVF